MVKYIFTFRPYILFFFIKKKIKFFNAYAFNTIILMNQQKGPLMSPFNLGY